MRFRVPLRLKSTSSLALVAAASWLGVWGRCLRLPAVSPVRRGDQVAGLRLRADQAGLSADSPGIDDPSGVLNGGCRAHAPFPRGGNGVDVAEFAPRMSGKISLFRLPEKNASGFTGGLRLFQRGLISPERRHRVRVNALSREQLQSHKLPTDGQRPVKVRPARSYAIGARTPAKNVA